MNNMKQIIRLTESDLHRIIKESVGRILAETNISAAMGSGKKSQEEIQEQLGISYMTTMNKARAMYDEYWWSAKGIAAAAAKLREKYGIPVKYFVWGINKAINM